MFKTPSETAEFCAALRDREGELVGHSERRQLFAETDETAALRVEGALDGGLSVIACVGETEGEREAGETDTVLRRQVETLRVVVHEDHLDRLALAYEPVWAIGTGRTATPDNAEELLRQPNVDGALVGGASLELDSFISICRSGATS